jgi:cell division transport system permease protein
MALSVVFATRAAMAGNRDVIEVLHFVGAEDAFIAREFQRHFLILGLKGGIGGGVAAMISFAVADWVTRGAQANAVSDQAQALFGGFSIGLTGYFGIIAIIVLVASLTAATSRLTVRGYLSQVD